MCVWHDVCDVASGDMKITAAVLLKILVRGLVIHSLLFTDQIVFVNISLECKKNSLSNFCLIKCKNPHLQEDQSLFIIKCLECLIWDSFISEKLHSNWPRSRLKCINSTAMSSAFSLDILLSIFYFGIKKKGTHGTTVLLSALYCLQLILSRVAI